ncbi:uncharacterized protein [Rutidosis leptorrhynchoides]|uniref:uncharacterized protein n=1 Tax=Rutidosis leptorrhynchoides TaxID=125765 RepID=UPI003A9935D4
MPMQYPLIFPYGEDGFREEILYVDEGGDERKRKKITVREFFAYRFQWRVGEAPNILRCGRLTQQIVVDAYATLETGEAQAAKLGKRVILPSSFVGGAMYMIQNYQDAMMIFKLVGYPDLFITFTCNTKWPEITRLCKASRTNVEDRPDILARVFKMKLDEFIRDVKNNKIFGELKAYVYTIEFQKRGLPHVHMLEKSSKFESPEDIDRYIFVELSDYLKKYVAVTSVGHDGYPVYRRRNEEKVVKRGEFLLDNRKVIPYNPYLMMKYRGHINVERCNQIRAIKYQFKCINKGNDRKREPIVERLSIHLENEQLVCYEEEERIENIVRRSSVIITKFTVWMEANRIYPNATSLYYSQFPSKFVWTSEEHIWTPRKQGFSIGRIYNIHPKVGDKFYLRMLVNKVKGTTSFKDLLTFNGRTYDTFKEICSVMGLLRDDEEYIDAILEVSYWGSAKYVRNMFITLLVFDELTNLENVWEKLGIYYLKNLRHTDMSIMQYEECFLCEDIFQNLLVLEIEKGLAHFGKNLSDYPFLPSVSSIDLSHQYNTLIRDETSCDRDEMTRQHKQLLESLNQEQMNAFQIIVNAVNEKNGGVFFIYGYGGTGKTHLWKTLSTGLRSIGELCLNSASNSGAFA